MLGSSEKINKQRPGVDVTVLQCQINKLNCDQYKETEVLGLQKAGIL